MTSSPGNDICNIGIIGEDGRYLINDSDTKINPWAGYEEMEWYKKALSGGGGNNYSHVLRSGNRIKFLSVPGISV